MLGFNLCAEAALPVVTPAKASLWDYAFHGSDVGVTLYKDDVKQMKYLFEIQNGKVFF